jgi:hypothetical protein
VLPFFTRYEAQKRWALDRKCPCTTFFNSYPKKISHEGMLGNERGETYCMISSENDQTPE